MKHIHSITFLLLLLITEFAHAGISITSPSIASVYNVTTNQNFTVTCNATPNVSGTTINRVNFYYWRDGVGVPLCTPNYPSTNPTECSVTGTGPNYTISNAKITAVPSNGGNDVVQCMGVVVNGINVGLPVGQELYVNVQAGVGVTAPAMPATISATANSSSQIAIAWANTPTNETYFELQRATNSTFTASLTTLSTTIAANTTNYVNSGLAASTTYFYRVRATNSGGSSTYKAMTTGVTTPAAPVTAPTMPATISATANSSSQITVSWTDSSNNETAFTLQRATNSGFTTGLTTLSSTIAANTTSYVNTGLAASTTYYYRVLASNSAGSSAYKAMTTGIATQATLTVPAAPSGMTGSASSSSQINLTWTDNASNESTFTLERATNSGFTSGLITVSSSIASISGTGASGLFADSPVTASTTYYYRVKAVNAAGSSAYSTSSAITTPAQITVPTIEKSRSTRMSVMAYATVQVSPAQITVKWANINGATFGTATIYRKTKTATTWTQIGTAAGSSNQYVDTTPAVGTYYEYKIQIPVTVSEGSSTAYGYIASGIQVPVVENRGKIILLVDSVTKNLSGMSTSLATFRKDLRSEGWTIVEHEVNRSTATPASVKSTIVSTYNADPTNVKALFIIGHVVVPYSGIYYGPDNHGDNKGAWAADNYYFDVNGSWTDSQTSPSPAYSFLANTPGDGRLDQNNIPSALELQGGRVDFFYMDEFSASYNIADDPVLYNAYFARDHAYRTRATTPQSRGFVFDNFADPSDPYNFAATGFRNISALVGPNNLTSQTNSSNPMYYNAVNNQSYLWTYACGGGSDVSASGVGSSGNFADVNTGGVFNLAFGSYFGNLFRGGNGNNNFTRAFISGANSAGLTNAWMGTTAGYFHHMGMGDPIGYSMVQSIGNKLSGTYFPEMGGNGTNTSWSSGENVAISLQGDPTLRMNLIKPPTNLAVNTSGNLLFSWTAPAGETGVSYIVYKVGATGGLTRVTPNPITTTSHQSTIANTVQGFDYVVKAYKLVTSATGTYYDVSSGSNYVTR